MRSVGNHEYYTALVPLILKIHSFTYFEKYHFLVDPILCMLDGAYNFIFLHTKDSIWSKVQDKFYITRNGYRVEKI